MNIHEQVLSDMLDMAEKFSRVGVKLQMPPASDATLGTRYTEIDAGKMLAAEVKFDPKFTNPMRVLHPRRNPRLRPLSAKNRVTESVDTNCYNKLVRAGAA
jgi:hypothetical protein